MTRNKVKEYTEEKCTRIIGKKNSECSREYMSAKLYDVTMQKSGWLFELADINKLENIHNQNKRIIIINWNLEEKNNNLNFNSDAYIIKSQWYLKS